MAIRDTRQIITVTAGENITALDYVFLAQPYAPYTYVDGIVPGRAYKTDKSIRAKSINADLCGFALDTVTAGQTVRVLTHGNLSGFTGLVAGRGYQPSSTAGQIELWEVNRNSLPTPKAVALSTTELVAMRPMYRIGGKGYVCVNAFSNALKFSDETIAASAALSSSRSYLSGAASSSLKGYYCGGDIPNNLVDAILFSSEIFSSIGNLTVGRYSGVSFASALKVYSAGGNGPSNIIDAVTFAVDGNSASITTLTTARISLAGSSSALKGYAIGGTGLNSAETLLYSNESNAALAGTLPNSADTRAGISSCLKSYVAGGNNPGVSNVIVAMPFSTEIWSSLAAYLSTARYTYRGSASSTLKGYVLGGYIAASSAIGDALLFSVETCAVNTSLLSAQAQLTGTQS